jgi:hypothetical protein
MTAATVAAARGLHLAGRAGFGRGSACGVRVLRRWWKRLVGGRWQRPLDTAARGPLGRRPDASIRPAHAGAELAERRAEAMRRLFPKLSAWQAPPSFSEQLGAAYEELSQAADLDDLEQRARRIEQRRRSAGVWRGFAPAGT